MIPSKFSHTLTSNTVPLSALLVVLAALLSSCGKGTEAAPSETAIQVSALKVSKVDEPIVAEFTGKTKGAVDAEIRARVEGVILKVHFEEGKEVKEGAPLYSIDPAPYMAKVAQARGHLAEQETLLVKAESDLKRTKPLVEMKALSARDLDRAVAQEGAARAAVDAAKAALQAAEIELSYCEIAAPIAGIIGLSQAKVGEFVGRPPNPVVLNTVSQLDPIHVLINITERDYLFFSRQKQQEIEAGEPSKKRELTMILADDSEHPFKGETVSVGRAVDPATGTIPVEAAFKNPHKLVRPGQFARIKTIAETAKGSILIPKRAVKELQGKFQVITISEESRAESKMVELGKEIGQNVIVLQGLKEGDVVALDGLNRLRAGVLVEPKFES